MYGPVIHDVRSFTVRMYYGNPNSKFESFKLICGFCDPCPCVKFLIPFVCGLDMSDLCFDGAIPVVLSMELVL